MPEFVQGIVLDSFKFKENSAVCKVFTKQYGIISIIINGLGRKSSNINHVYLQPLTQIECVVYIKEKKGIFRVKELNLQVSVFGILPDIRKYSIAVFIAEIVVKTFREFEPDYRLYSLLANIVMNISKKEANVQDIHLFFLCAYADILGFSLKSEEDFGHNHIKELEPKAIEALHILTEMEDYSSLGITKNMRGSLIRFILRYLERHMEMPKIKSLQILEEVLS